MSKILNTLHTCAVVSLLLAGPAACAGEKGKPPPFPISQESQQLAYKYLVCATHAFEEKYTGTIELDEAVNYSLGKCADAKKLADDSVRQDAKKASCESCAQDVITEMDKEVRRKLTGDIDYDEEEAERGL